MGEGRRSSGIRHPIRRVHDPARVARSKKDSGQYAGTAQASGRRVESDCGATCSTCHHCRGTSSHPRNRTSDPDPVAAFYQGRSSPEALVMRWFWHKRHNPEVAEAERDLRPAKLARGRAARASEHVRPRWTFVEQITYESRTLRYENHLAESIIALFRSH